MRDQGHVYERFILIENNSGQVKQVMLDTPYDLFRQAAALIATTDVVSELISRSHMLVDEDLARLKELVERLTLDKITRRVKGVAQL